MTNLCQKGLTKDRELLEGGGGGVGLRLSIKEVGPEGRSEGAILHFGATHTIP